MITQEMKNNKVYCKSKGINCYKCKDAKICVEYVECKDPTDNENYIKDGLKIALEKKQRIILEADKEWREISIKLVNKCIERGHRHDDGSYAPVIIADNPRDGMLGQCPICGKYM